MRHLNCAEEAGPPSAATKVFWVAVKAAHCRDHSLGLVGVAGLLRHYSEGASIRKRLRAIATTGDRRRGSPTPRGNPTGVWRTRAYPLSNRLNYWSGAGVVLPRCVHLVWRRCRWKRSKAVSCPFFGLLRSLDPATPREIRIDGHFRLLCFYAQTSPRRLCFHLDCEPTRCSDITPVVAVDKKRWDGSEGQPAVARVVRAQLAPVQPHTLPSQTSVHPKAGASQWVFPIALKLPMPL